MLVPVIPLVAVICVVRTVVVMVPATITHIVMVPVAVAATVSPENASGIGEQRDGDYQTQ